jgi:hypothetical protein
MRWSQPLFFASFIVAVLSTKITFNNFASNKPDLTGPEQSRTTSTMVDFGDSNPVAVSSTLTWRRVAPTKLDIKFPVEVLSKVSGSTPTVHLELPPPPEGTRMTGVQLITLDFLPQGHPGYSIPHFDVHFFLISGETVHGIIPAPESCFPVPSGPLCACFPANCSIFAECTQTPSFGTLGPNLKAWHGCIPFMGQHYLLSQFYTEGESPEAQLFLHGSWDGVHSFYEPMPRLTFLQSLGGGQRQCYDIPEVFPSNLRSSGWYATQYCYSKIGGLLSFSLENWVWRVRSDSLNPGCIQQPTCP